MIKAFFEKQDYEIIRYINNAQRTIDLCVAWINMENIIVAIKNAKSRGVRIRIITSNRNKNNDLINYSDTYKTINLPGLGLMHNKYCIIDNEIVITGSYNWTQNATNNNFENIIICDDYNYIYQFCKDFVELLIFSETELTIHHCNKCKGKTFNLLFVVNEDYNLETDCISYTICTSCGDIIENNPEFSFNILNSLEGEITEIEINEFLSSQAENNFDKKYQAIGIPYITGDHNDLYTSCRVVYKNKYFSRYIEDTYDLNF